MKEADETIQYHPEMCEGCPNFEVCKVFGISETKYDVDIIIETKVTVHKVLSYECPNKNNKVISGCFPSNIKSTMHYEDNLEALVIALNTCGDGLAVKIKSKIKFRITLDYTFKVIFLL